MTHHVQKQQECQPWHALISLADSDSTGQQVFMANRKRTARLCAGSGYCRQ
jgi:hypothetical protein